MYKTFRKEGNMITETIGKYRIESFEDYGKLLVKIFNTNAKKEWNQQIAYYSFSTEQARTDYINGFKERAKHRIDDVIKRREARKNFKNPAKIGDILCSTWGYDQTNVDYYQVTKVIGKMVEIREICGKHVEGSGYSHGMADEVMPVKDRFVEKAEPMKKRVGSSYGEPNGYGVSINTYASAYKIEETEKHYRSWYA